MEFSDSSEWKRLVDINIDPYGAEVMAYAERWANLMEAEMANGAKLADIADKTSDTANINGITGFMHGYAVHTLSMTWKFGAELRAWHNNLYGVSDVSGTVDPASLSIHEKDDQNA